MKLKNILLILICVFFLVGCKEQEETDANKFKNEYEQYNDTKIKIEIEEDNIITYANSSKINNIIKEGTGVIFIGEPKNNLSRTAIKVLLKASDSTDLNNIYYINSLENIEGLDNIDNLQIPIVINVLEGTITSYHIGTINNKEQLTDDEEIELYNTYLEGIHEVLQDSCDERC